MTDRDLRDLLPASPPPRADRREAAIGAALRRFDGVVEAPRPAPIHRSWAWNPRVGALAAAALVAAVGLPLWLAGERPPPAAPASIVREMPASADVAAPTEAAQPAQLAAAPTASTEPPASNSAPLPRAEAADSTALAEAAPPPAVVSAPAPALAAPRAPAFAVAAPPPPAPAAEVADDAGSIVITGARVSGRAAALQRTRATLGAWNRCTLADPRQDADACRPRGRVGPPSANTRSATFVADGLAAAWRGERDEASAALDRAIAAAPRSGAARLNRGLLRAETGDDAAALADLDAAVRAAPRDAQVRYQRSLLLRRLGQDKRADADAARAAALDPRYAEVVE